MYQCKGCGKAGSHQHTYGPYFFKLCLTLSWFHRVFAQRWRARQRIVFLENFCFRFSMSLKDIQRRLARFGLSFAVLYIKKNYFLH